MHLLDDVVDVLVTLMEAAGVAVIAVGSLWALVRFLVDGVRQRDASAFTAIRLSLGRFLGLGLEFLLAADILMTAVAPTFEEIGKLAAIAAIRTALNYFLSREVTEEQRRMSEQPSGPAEPSRNVNQPA